MNNAPQSVETAPRNVPDPNRYNKIEKQNEESFFFNEPLMMTVVTSISGRETRLHPHPKTRDGGSISYAGNMSEMWGNKDLSDDERVADARQNVDNFVRQPGIDKDPANVRILLPQRSYGIPLQVIDIDSLPVDPENKAAKSIEDRGDMLVTRNPEIILGVRPADCPVMFMTGFDEEGKAVYGLAHIAYDGARAGFVAQAVEQFLAQGVPLESMRINITAGGQAENFLYVGDNDPLEGTTGLEDLYVNLRNVVEDGKNKIAFGIDTPNFVYKELLRAGLSPYQLNLDTSDTASLVSQYSSHGRAERSRRAWVANGSNPAEDYELGKRDLILGIPATA